METIRLKHFKAVVETGGITKASELLGISPGGLSKSIKALENELGFDLFHQKGRGLELTEIGNLFYQRLPSALEAIESLTALNSQKTEGQKELIRFATFEVFSTYFLSHFISKEISDKAVEIREAIPGEMEKLIADGHSDIGITYEPIPYRGVDFLKISKIKMGIFTRKDSSLLELPLESLPFVIPMAPLTGTPSGVKGLDGWPEHRFNRADQYRVEMMQTALQLAASGVAVAFLPQFIANFYNSNISSKSQLEEYKNTPKFKTVTRDVYIITRKGYEENRLIKKLAKAIRNL